MKRQINTFEDKIKQTFIKYGHIPFLIMVLVLVCFFSYEYAFRNIFMSSRAQKEIEKQITVLESTLNEHIDEIQVLAKSSNFIPEQSVLYENYYKSANATSLSLQMAILDSDLKPVFITLPSMYVSEYQRTFNQIYTSRLNQEHLTLSTTQIPVLSQAHHTLVFGRDIVDQNERTFHVLYYVDPDSFDILLQHKTVPNIVVTDQFGYVVATTSPKFIGSISRFNPSRERNILLNETPYRVRSRSLLQNNLWIHTISPHDSFLKNYSLLIIFMIATGIFMNRANKTVAQRVGRESSASIEILMNGIEKLIDGDLSYQVEINTNDEFELLGDAFNIMAQRLNVAFEDNRELTDLKNKAQIKQLEAQFNPHFLYNSLETIRYLIDYDPNTAQKLILNITNLLRYSIDDHDNYVQLGDDILYVERYLEINKIRLMERFDYDIEIDDEIKNLRIPKLLIQPLIENSIKHGYKDKGYLKVSIIGSQDESNIYLDVNDNGSGLEATTLNQIVAMKENPQMDGNSYGIRSIIKRLHLIYGPGSHLNIESSPLVTKIRLVIPKGELYDKSLRD